jgi:hypothetical protein
VSVFTQLFFERISNNHKSAEPRVFCRVLSFFFKNIFKHFHDPQKKISELIFGQICKVFAGNLLGFLGGLLDFFWDFDPGFVEGRLCGIFFSRNWVGPRFDRLLVSSCVAVYHVPVIAAV